MTCETCTHAYDGVGPALIAPYPNINNNRNVGNSQMLKYTFTTNRREQPNWNNPAGGLCASASFVEKMDGEMSIADLCPENLALANLATITVIGVTPVVDEVHTAYYEGIVILNAIPNTSVSPVVTDTGGVTTYTEGTDYTVDRLGIKILSTGTIPDASVIEVDYTPIGSTKIDALTTPNSDQILIFSGVNRMRNNSPEKLIFHRIRIDAVEEAEVKTEGDQGTILVLKFSCLPKDVNAVSADISEYMTKEQIT